MLPKFLRIWEPSEKRSHFSSLGGFFKHLASWPFTQTPLKFKIQASSIHMNSIFFNFWGFFHKKPFFKPSNTWKFIFSDFKFDQFFGYPLSMWLTFIFNQKKKKIHKIQDLVLKILISWKKIQKNFRKLQKLFMKSVLAVSKSKTPSPFISHPSKVLELDFGTICQFCQISPLFSCWKKSTFLSKKLKILQKSQFFCQGIFLWVSYPSVTSNSLKRPWTLQILAISTMAHSK